MPLEDGLTPAAAADVRKLRNCINNGSPFMEFFSAEGLYELVGTPQFRERLQSAITMALDKERASLQKGRVS